MADQGTQGWLSPYLRAQRMDAARPYLHGRVLDFGCGSGALADLVPPHQYFGVDVDSLSLQQARLKYPNHRFLPSPPESSERFQTVVSLAVIEHVHDPVDFLQRLAGYLDDTPGARILITTPHPAAGWIHDVGARMGLFSRDASEEHHELLDEKRLSSVGEQAGLKISAYHRFLWGANQLAIFERGSR